MEESPLQNSDETWFIAEVTQIQAGLAGLAFSLIPDRMAADEVLQETNLVLWNKREQFEQGTNFRAWAFRVLRFQAMAFLKSETRRARKEVLAFDEDLMEKLADEAAWVLERQSDRVIALRKCLTKLSADDRQLIEEHYLEGGIEASTMEEEAAAIGRSVGAFRQVLYRIRTSLRRCIDKTLAEEAALLV